MHRSSRLLPFLLLVLCACPQGFEEIRVVATGAATTFEIPRVESGLRTGSTFELLDLTVIRADCSRDCTLWSVVRTDAAAGTANLSTHRIEYGVAPDGMERRTDARPLAPGSYSVSATIQQYDDAGMLTRSIAAFGRFTTHTDE